MPTDLFGKLDDYKSQINYFSINKPKQTFLKKKNCYFFYIENNFLIAYKNNETQKIISLENINCVIYILL